MGDLFLLAEGGADRGPLVGGERKNGGAYLTVTGRLKKLDEIQRVLVLTDGTKIPLDDVAGLESECFQEQSQIEYV